MMQQCTTILAMAWAACKFPAGGINSYTLKHLKQRLVVRLVPIMEVILYFSNHLACARSTFSFVHKQQRSQSHQFISVCCHSPFTKMTLTYSSVISLSFSQQPYPLQNFPMNDCNKQPHGKNQHSNKISYESNTFWIKKFRNLNQLILHLNYEPSSFFHLAYPSRSRKSKKQIAKVIPTKGPKTPFILYNWQGMFIPNTPAIRVSAAMANEAIVNVSCN